MAFVDLGPEVPDPTPEDVLQLAEDGSEMPKRDVNDPGVNYEEFQSGLRTAIQSAINYAEEELAQKRKTAQEFYDGDELEGDSELDETRSKFISRDVHDTVKKMLPSLLRVFFGGRSVVAYDPVGPEDEPFAKQATDYVNDIVLQKDNAGFKIFYDVFWDTLVKGLGTVMWYWQDNYEVVGQEYAGLNEQDVHENGSGRGFSFAIQRH